MSEFIAYLAVLLTLMFSGVVSWLMLPIIFAIRFPLRRSWTGDAWGKLISDLVGIYLVASLTVQLTQDHQKHSGALLGAYPYISALFLFVITLEGSIDKRQEIMQDAKNWTRCPHLVPDVRFWKVVPVVVLPIFLFLFFVPLANVPYVYFGFSTVLSWLFNLRFVGPILEVLAEIWGALLFFGCLKYLLFRVAGRLAPAYKPDSN